MKKSIIAVALLVTMLFLTNGVFASPNSMSDVPKNHWAYQAVSQLVNAGLVDGYKDSFNGERTLTRYEFAVIVAKTLSKLDKADADNRAVIDKLSAEFASELNTLGVRVENLEKKVSPIRMAGILDTTYDYVKNPTWITKKGESRTEKNEFRFHMFLFMNADLDENVKFQAVWEEQHVAGDVEVPTSPDSGGLDAAFIDAKTPGAEYTVGRQLLKLNQGFLVNSPLIDGAMVKVGDKTTLSAGVLKQGIMGTEIKVGELRIPIEKHSNIALDYFKGNYAGTDLYKAKLIGFDYREIPGISLSGEYDKNDGTRAKGWFGRIEKGGAIPFVVGSKGYWIVYRSADDNLDPLTFGTSSTLGPEAVVNDDIKGFEFGIDQTIYKGGILKLRYSPAKSIDGKTDKTFYQIMLSSLMF
ncbi:MAG: S-layer y domain protein [Firmicutes bacterium]|nr:S-layer y domain protein [Bacillota bacterium]